MSIKLERNPLSTEIEELKKGEIGLIVCKGLAELVASNINQLLDKPKFPIDYLAKWLINVNNEKQKVQQLNQQILNQNDYKLKIIEIEKKKQDELKNKQIEVEAKQKEENDLLEKIKNHNNHKQFLEQEYPQIFKDKFNLAGVYIGYVENSSTDERLIKYFGFSDNQQFMDQRVLPKDQGVTYGLYKDEVVQEEGEEGEKKIKKNHIYIPNVVQEPRMFYFKIPKLGSYLAVKMTYNSYLNENKFKESVNNKQSQLTAKLELKVMIEEREQTYKKEISEAEPDQVEEINQSYQLQKQKDIEALNAGISLPYEKQDYLVAMDTCGQDREITQKEIDQILLNIQYFGQQWENKELELWNADIDNYIKYQEKINKETLQIIERFSEQEEIYLKQNIQSLDVILYIKKKWANYEKIYEYEQNSLKLEKIKKQIKSKEVQEWLQILSEYQVVQYPELFRIILIFMGYQKEQILLKNSDKLDWINLRSLLINEDFILKLTNYSHRGPKPEQVPAHMKIQNFAKQLENLNESEINEFNLGYGRLYKWLFYTCKCRISDVLARRELKEESKQNRLKAEKQQQEWEQQKEQFIQKAYEALNEEDRVHFDKNATELEYISQNPEIVIPNEILTDDIDEDFE